MTKEERAQARRELFWTLVDKSKGFEGCWPFTGPKRVQGYGGFYVKADGRKYTSAHRVAYFFTYGHVPEGLFVCHHCDNPPCCNPAHLWLGTAQDNTADMVLKGRSAKGDRQSSRLHPETRPRGKTHQAYLHPEWTIRGERHGCAKLKADDVREIRKLIEAGGGWTAVGRQYGVDERTVRDLVTRTTWKHVE